MTTKVRLRQLESKFDKARNKDKYVEVVRHITQDGRLIDGEGYFLSEAEASQIEKENEEVSKNGGMVIYLTQFSEPQARTAGSSAQ
ncbi:MAG: hypothetical protein A3A65_01330 [Candidatus Chisholmbacteria bacterium RIFCSPLOWO2_01_FULL_49_14]|uniref:Uncharacterized protein n=1 Tax=Candidatus Chisholmbacteria bacterium RIFCSPLOWO2_01_FULL_49_14 TaxID=1797593 RepID=A0A1G1VZF8_9BACT|nr:MAG: hypothetical protein A3A65_01330 [Candidatus Chisholmbacteria bacterium RIFCSPLOWO2_01_FULL_49_14]